MLFDSAITISTVLLTINLLVCSLQNLSSHSLLNVLSEVSLNASIKSRITVSHSINLMIFSLFDFDPILTLIVVELLVKETVLLNDVTIHDLVKSDLIISLT